MAQDPLHVLWVEPNFPGRLGAVADWLVRRRGYRSSFYCHTADPRAFWPPSVGKGLDCPGVWRRRRRSRVGRDLVAGTRAQPLLCLRLLGSPRAEAAAADRPDRRPLQRPGLGTLRAGLLAGRTGGQLPRLLLPRPPPRPGRRGRSGDRAGLLSLAAVDGRDRASGSGTDRAGLDADATGSATCFRPSTATNSSSCTTASTPGGFARSSWHAAGTRPAIHCRPGDPARNAGRQLRGSIARPPSRVRSVPERGQCRSSGSSRRSVCRRGRPDRPSRSGRRIS